MFILTKFVAPIIALCTATVLLAQEIELPDSPLRHSIAQLQIETREYPGYHAREWQLQLHAPDDQPAPLIENLLSADLEVAIGGPQPVDLHWNKGSHAEATDFQPMTDRMVTGQSLQLESFGGRSSDGVLPYFNLAGEHAGMIIAIGWSGDWQANFELGPGGKVRVRAGVKRSRFRMQPGERLRLPSILVMAYRGSWIDGQNQFRRLMLEHFTPTNYPPLELMPVAASVHGMIGFNDTDEAKLLSLIEDIAALKLPIDTFWLDAGWNDGGFPGGQGTWPADAKRFPNGLASVGAAVQRAGWRFLVWFEPERAMRGSQLDRQHAHWLLLPTATPAALSYMERDGFQLLNMGDRQARQFAQEHVSAQIDLAQIGIYRHDMNAYPAYFWHTAESSDQTGLSEIRYITGLYEYLDHLAQRHPRLILDHCASGGRRLDFEMMRRCVALWRSDSCWDDVSYPRNVQCMTHGLSLWLPLHGLGSVRTDANSLRSGLGACASFAINYRDETSVAALREHLARYLPIRHLYTKDFYPLTPWSDEPNHWLACQWFDSHSGTGVVQVFCGGQPTPASQTIRLEGVDATARYQVTSWDEPERPTIYTGAQLSSAGLMVTSTGQPQAQLFTIERR